MSKVPQDVTDIEQAKRNAAVARARVQSTAGALKQRVSPANIAAGAKERVREKTDAIGSAAQRRPVATGAVAGVAGLIVFRKPLKRIAKRLFGRSGTREERKAAKAERKASKRAAKEARISKRALDALTTSNPLPNAVATNGSAPAKQE